jgi:hypothetical protein
MPYPSPHLPLRPLEYSRTEGHDAFHPARPRIILASTIHLYREYKSKTQTLEDVSYLVP